MMNFKNTFGLIVAVVVLGANLLIGCNTVNAEEVDVPKSFGFLTDFTGTIPDQTTGALEIRNRAIEIQKNESTRATVLTLIVPSTKGEPIADYAQRVAEAWRPGSTSEERGVVLVIAKTDKTWAIKTSRNVSDTLTDYNAKKLLTNMAQHLKQHKGDFVGAVILFYSEIPHYLSAPAKEVAAHHSTITATFDPGKADEGLPGWVWFMLFAVFTGGALVALYAWFNHKEKQAREAAEEAEREYRERVHERERERERQREADRSRSVPSHNKGVQGVQGPSGYIRKSSPQVVLQHVGEDAELVRQRQEQAELARRRQEHEQRESKAEEARRRRRRDDDEDNSSVDLAASVLAGAASVLAGAASASSSSPEPSPSSEPSPEPNCGSSAESFDGGGASGSFN